MPRKKRNLTKEQKEKEYQRTRQNKLNSIKTDFEAGKIRGFDQVFAVMVESRLARELGMGFTTFRNKRLSPGDFTNNELIRFAELVDIDINIMLKFIFSLIKNKNRKAPALENVTV